MVIDPPDDVSKKGEKEVKDKEAREQKDMEIDE